MATERATRQIPIEDFDQEVHDPDEYFERFESAVGLATGVTEATRKGVLAKMWLPMKLNAAARMILRSCNNAAAWAALIAEFKSKLITPQDKYNWRSGKRKITWDGRESFHVLAERVKRTVDRYEDQPREKDYFYEFRQALPRNYKQAIDYHNEGNETLEIAKKIALRLQAALPAESEPDESAGAVGGKTVSFVGESMSEDRIDSMERSLSKMMVSQEDLGAKIAQLQKKSGNNHAAHCSYDSSQDYRHPHDSDQWGSSGDTVLEPHSDAGRSQNRQYDGWNHDRRYEYDSTCDGQFDDGNPSGRQYDGSTRNRLCDNGFARDRQFDRGSSSDCSYDRQRSNGYASNQRYEHDSSYRQQNEARPSLPSDRRYNDSFSSDRRHISEPRQQCDGGSDDYHLPPSSYQW